MRKRKQDKNVVWCKEGHGFRRARNATPTLASRFALLFALSWNTQKKKMTFVLQKSRPFLLSNSHIEYNLHISETFEALVKVSDWLKDHFVCLFVLFILFYFIIIIFFWGGGWGAEFSVTLLNRDLTPVPVVRDLGVRLDACLSYNEHITETVSNCLLKLKQINRIKAYFGTLSRRNFGRL